ncbi:hypothetical protein Tco_1285054 [Tanacetum coccineum]
MANETLSPELKRYKERVKLLEERQNVDLGTREKLIIDDIIWDKDAQFADFEKEINTLKQTLSEQLKEKESLTKTFNVFKKESKEKEAKNIDNEIALEKKVKELDNIVHKKKLTKPQVFYDNNLRQALVFQNPFYLKKAQHIRPMLYDGSVIGKETNVISIVDSKETLMLEEESRSKMLLKQSDPMVLEKKVNIKPINYAGLNRLSEDFGKHFVPQEELSDEQAFRLQTSNPNTDQSASFPVKIKAPRELPMSSTRMEQICDGCQASEGFASTTLIQLHAYLKQHELHANEVRLLRKRNQDPVAFVSNQQMTPPYFNTYQSSYNNSQLQQQFSPSQFGSIHPNQHYSSTYPSQP